MLSFIASQNLLFSLSIVFENENDEIKFQETFGRCMYEHTNREEFEKLNKEDAKYLLQAYKDVEMIDAPEEGS